MTFIKVLATLAVLAVLGAAAWFVKGILDEIASPQLGASHLRESLESAQLPDVEPDELAFQRAIELVATSQFDEAREKFLFIVNFFPSSNSADEARRILGELNLDEVLSTDSMEGKAVHKVVRGDSFLKIATKYDTTLDAIVHLNGLQGLDRLHPGDELVVMPLQFNVRIEAGKKRLSLWRDGRFVTSYPLVEVRSGESASGVIRTKVRNKMGIEGTRVFRPIDEGYRTAAKVISLEARGLQIRQVPGGEEEDPGRGFFLNGPDMEELALLLRVGNEVEVRFPTQ
ncbi:MAG: LysM peptidoglycan-binding domain-containing protein [Akkermansiaceae bacterium]|nr:LysM peptidoglycan-binding domain-containing protein [Akkermansiaceae bacterium]NNM31048.1 LysM peptidoglycan-binding domain-containing protein [Akkermansiaceae bacterium]